MNRRLFVLTACALTAAAALAMGCSKKSSETPVTGTPGADTAASVSTPGAGGLSPQQIADTVSKTVCKRMTTCNPQGGSEADCATGLSKDMAGNLSDAAKAITQPQLDACTAAITKASCDQLKADTPPAGCEFMN